MQITRRTLLTGAAVGIATAALPRASWAASTFAVGGMELTTLSDGFLTQPADFIFAPMPQDDLATFLASRGIARAAPITPPCNLTLLRHEGRLVLFDAGAGTGFVDTVGTLPDALGALGIDPGVITHVVFTHGHADHLWGVVDDFDEPFFANAEHLMGRTEYAYWADPDTAITADPGRVAMAVGAKRRLDLVGERFRLFDDGAELLPGVIARASHGHTPGHMSFVLADGGRSAMVVGDAILNDHTVFAHPEWHIGADADRELAAKVRTGLLDQVATDAMTMIAFHLPSGGVGQVERYEGAYRFVPA